MKILETENVEFKRQLTDDLKKTVVAFANSNGGTIYIGIEDDGSVTGVENPDKTLLSATNMLRDSIKPDVTMFVSYETRRVEGRQLVLIHVQQGTERPYYLAAKGLKPAGVFIRHGASSAPATDSAIRRLIKETDGDRYESVRSFNQELTFEYARKEFAARNIEFGQSHMISLGLLTGKDNIFTNLGLLLSDQCLHTIKGAVFQGKTREIFKDRREFSGSLLSQLTEAYDFIDLNNHTRATISGLHRSDTRDFPEVALREALLNAVVHREYSMSSSTLISIFDDRIEIVSFGGLIKGITLNDIMLGISVTRNEKLASLLYRLKLIEAYGTGIAKILDCYKHHKNKPEIKVSDNAFQICLPNVNRHENDSELSESELVVMKLFTTRNFISRKDVEQALGISQTMAGRILKQLIQKSIIARSGAGSKTQYRHQQKS